MIKHKDPKRLWYFDMVYKSKILYIISRGHDSRTGMERIKGDTVNISKWTDYYFYDLYWYWATPNDWDNPNLGGWLGVYHRICRSLCCLILNNIGTVLANITVQHVTRDEIANTEIINRIRYYHKKLKKEIGEMTSMP